jgi:hypothetical protein
VGFEMDTNQGSPESISAMMDMVSEKIPKMINGVINTLFSAEAGENVGAAVGSMYKMLIEAGVPKGEAADMSRHYMDSVLNIMKDINNIKVNQDPGSDDKQA